MQFARFAPLLVGCLSISTVCGQAPFADFEYAPVLALDMQLTSAAPALPGSRKTGPEFRLFGVPTDIVLQDGTPSLGLLEPERRDATPGTNQDSSSTSFERIQVMAGVHNPYCDFPWRPRVDGPGTYRTWASIGLLDTEKSALALGLDLLTPDQFTGTSWQQRPSSLVTSLAWCHALNQETTLEVVLRKNLEATVTGIQPADSRLGYGVAVTRALPQGNGPPGVQLFLEVLGNGGEIPDSRTRATSSVNLLPGLRWQQGAQTWSSGIGLPLLAADPDIPWWQVTCAWQF